MNHLPSEKVPMVCRKFAELLSLIPLALIIVECAGEVPPSGGPPDTVPPTIIRTVPDSNAVRVGKNKVEFEFSEYVDRRTVEESIFISPYVGELEFDWSGTEVEIAFSEPLKRNTTYVVNVGTDVKDQRAQNRMAAGYTLAFSTGDSIDQGYISGRVFDEKPEGVMIFAYGLQNVNPDTLNPSTSKPDYIMQTGKGGTFALSNIAYGPYRVFAVRDEFRNFLYDKQIDQYGVANDGVILNRDHGRVEDLWFRLSREDTSRPFLSNVQPVDRQRLRVRFSEPIDTSSFDHAMFELSDTLATKTFPLALAYFDRHDPSVAGVVTQIPLDSALTYRLRVRNVRDRAGNSLDSTHASMDFVGINAPDTTKPTFTIRDLSSGSTGYLPEWPVEIDFSEPVRREPLASAITFSDSARKLLAFELQWLNPATITIMTPKPPDYGMWYQIRIVVDSVVDLQGNRFKDSTFTLRFQTLDLRTTGNVDGTVMDEKGDEGKGDVYVTASSIDAVTPHERTIHLRSTGRFRMERLIEGKYVLRAFRDADGNGVYSYGVPYPFHPAERFTVNRDTIKVRARWDVEGVLLKFKK
jgi:hypothetical protein